MSEMEIKKETILNTLFECREEKLFRIIEKLPYAQDLENIKNSLDSYIDRINVIGTYENEKRYRL